LGGCDQEDHDFRPAWQKTSATARPPSQLKKLSVMASLSFQLLMKAKRRMLIQAGLGKK
jgi:hypothetical protein